MKGGRPLEAGRRAPLSAAAAGGALLVAGCHLYLWSWSSESGTHELTVPPQAEATPEPTPQPVPTFESRY
jgi:hypothetical protein